MTTNLTVMTQTALPERSPNEPDASKLHGVFLLKVCAYRLLKCHAVWGGCGSNRRINYGLSDDGMMMALELLRSRMIQPWRRCSLAVLETLRRWDYDNIYLVHFLCMCAWARDKSSKGRRLNVASDHL